MEREAINLVNEKLNDEAIVLATLIHSYTYTNAIILCAIKANDDSRYTCISNATVAAIKAIHVVAVWQSIQ